MTAKVSVAQACNRIGLSNGGSEHQKLYASLLADLQALQGAYAALLLKLDADGGVTDVNYHSLAATAAPTLNTVP